MHTQYSVDRKMMLFSTYTICPNHYSTILGYQQFLKEPIHIRKTYILAVDFPSTTSIMRQNYSTVKFGKPEIRKAAKISFSDSSRWNENDTDF